MAGVKRWMVVEVVMHRQVVVVVVAVFVLEVKRCWAMAGLNGKLEWCVDVGIKYMCMGRSWQGGYGRW